MVKGFHILFCLIILLLSLNSQAQDIAAISHISLEAGMQERESNQILRDRYGFFYVFLNNHIQRWDGQQFEDVDISILEGNHKVLQNELNCQLNNNGDMVLFSNGSPEEKYFIEAGDLLLKTRKVKQNNISTNSNNSITVDNKELSFFERNDSMACIQLEDKIIELGKGRIIDVDNRLIYVDSFSINEWKDGSLINLVEFKEPMGFPAIVRKDKQSQVAIAYRKSMKKISSLHVLSADDEIYDFSEFLKTSTIIKDFCADNFFDEWMIASYIGLYQMKLIPEGIRWIYFREGLERDAFGHVITSILDGKEKGIFFLNEFRGLFNYKDGELFRISDSFHKKRAFDYNQKMIFNHDSTRIISYTYGEVNASTILISDLESNEVIQYYVPFYINGLRLEDEKTVILYGHLNQKAKLGFLNIQNGNIDFIDVSGEAINDIYYDEINKKYILATPTSVYTCDKNFSLHPDNIFNGLTANVRIIRKFKDEYWFGTYGNGVLIYDENGKRINHLNSKSGLSNDLCVSLETDDNNNKWIGTFNGLNIIDSKGRFKRALYLADGLCHNEFNTKSSTIDSKGLLYFGTVNGINRIDPEKILNTPITNSGIYIDKIQVHKSKNIEEFNFNSDSTLTIDYFLDSIAIFLSRPSYRKNIYLDPTEELLINGSIEGRLKIYNNRIVFYEKPENLIFKSFSGFSIVQNFDYQVDFVPILLMILGFVGIVSLSFIVSSIILKRKQNRIDEKNRLEKRISDLQLSALQSQMNPHFIFNALGSIQYFIQTKDINKADDYLSDFAQLMRLILESSKSELIHLKDEIHLLKLYVSLEKVRFDKKFEYSFELDDDLQTELLIPPMILQPFIENSINHGLNNLSDRQGYLNISFNQFEDERIKCIIEDNGIGREAAGKLRNKKHISRGMQIVQERIKTIKESENIDIKVKIIDLEKENIPTGTRIEIDFTFQ